MPLYNPTPADPSPRLVAPTGAVAETFPRSTATLGTIAALTSGTLRLIAAPLAAGTTITSLRFTAIGAATTPTNQWAGLFDPARAALALSADDLTAAWAANTTKTFTLTAPVTVTTSGLYYFGLLVAAAAVPTLAGVTSTSVVTARAPVTCGNSDTGLTAPPALPFTAAAITASGLMPYADAA